MIPRNSILHSTRGAAASCSHRIGVVLRDMVVAVGWSSNSTFTQFCNRPTATSLVSKAVLQSCLLIQNCKTMQHNQWFRSSTVFNHPVIVTHYFDSLAKSQGIHIQHKIRRRFMSTSVRKLITATKSYITDKFWIHCNRPLYSICITCIFQVTNPWVAFVSTQNSIFFPDRSLESVIN